MAFETFVDTFPGVSFPLLWFILCKCCAVRRLALALAQIRKPFTSS